MTDSPLSTLSADERALLDRFGFDEPRWNALRQRLADPRPDDNAVRGSIEVPRASDMPSLPAPGSTERARLEALGRAAIARGEVGAVVLAGGMATRFGGVVKAAVPVVGDKTFLDLKLLDIAHAAAGAGGIVPTYLMTSFATDGDVRQLADAANTPAVPVEAFAQFVSLRVDAKGALFREADGTVSPYGPGHGDLTFALRRSGVLSRFRQRGGRYLYMSNVDNLAATLDPAVLGAHLDVGRAITVEVVDKVPGDKGGAPARVDGVLQIVEAFRFPASFDQDSIPVFNTNSFVLDAAAIDREFDLTYFVVRKKVDGREVVQFERLVGELTAFLPTHFVRVSREGLDGRFLPVKDPDELEQRRAEIVALLRARSGLAP